MAPVKKKNLTCTSLLCKLFRFLGKKFRVLQGLNSVHTVMRLEPIDILFMCQVVLNRIIDSKGPWSHTVA